MLSRAGTRFSSRPVFSYLCTSMLFLMSISPVCIQAAQNLYIGPAERLYTDAQMPFTWDGSMVALKKDSTTFNFFVSAAATFGGGPLRYAGPLSNPFQQQLPSAVIDYSSVVGNYAPWLMHIYKHTDGMLIGFCHHEQVCCGGPDNRFFMGVAKSTDNGATWKYLGHSVAPQSNTGSETNTGGHPCIIVGEYFYVYFNDYTPDKVRAVARAKIADVVAACQQNIIPVFTKYNNGSWNQNGLTGAGSDLLPGPEEYDLHSDAAYCAPLGKYLITMQTHGINKLLLYTSTDGINWGEETVVDEAPNAWHCYSSIFGSIGANDESSVVGNEFYIYFPRKSSNDYNYDDYYRRKITVIGSGIDTFTSMSITPENSTVSPGQTAQYTASALNQYGIPLASQPTFSFSVSDGGSISTNGLFTAESVEGGPYRVIVSATVNSVTRRDTALVTVSRSWTFPLQFSGTQGADSWYYMFYKNGAYSNLTWNGSAWKDASEPYMQVVSDAMHPGAAADVVLAWKVPAGLTAISVAGTISDDDAGGGDGIIATIKQDATTVWGLSTVDNGNMIGQSYSLSLNVTAGQYIYFVVNRNGTDGWDTSCWNITIMPRSVTGIEGRSTAHGLLQPRLIAPVRLRHGSTPQLGGYEAYTLAGKRVDGKGIVKAGVFLIRGDRLAGKKMAVVK